jgi:molybdopterin converting factor small subunit
MNIRVIIYGSLLRPEGKHDYLKVVPEGATVRELIVALGYKPQHVTTILSTVNGRQASHNMRLKDGDEIVLSVMIGGG